MSDKGEMEKEFTVDELAGGESLVDDEDLTDEEYVEALGEHDEDGKKISSDGTSKHEQRRSPSSSSGGAVKKLEEKESCSIKNKENQPGGEAKSTERGVNSQMESGESKDGPKVDEETKDNKPISVCDPEEKKEIEKTEICETQAVDPLDGNAEGGDQEDDAGGGGEEDDEEEDGDEDEAKEDDSDEIDEEEKEDEDDDESIVGEHEPDDGNGQETSELSKQVDKELDDDEDRRNPQYIPKRGAFYEHDDRLGTDEEEDEEKEPEKTETVEKKAEPVVEARKAKKLWSDDGKWGHDMFDGDEQKPKAKDEIVSTYGYDIRNEDGPPKARRRRRYGRGPNRYTRSWKDEGAYSKPNEAPIKGKAKPEDKDIQKEREERPLRSREMSDKPSTSKRRSGSRGRRRNESKTPMEGKKQREKDVRDLGPPRERDRKRNESINRDPGPSKEHREHRDHRDHRDHKEPRDHREYREHREHREHRDHKDHRERRDRRDPREPKESRDFRDRDGRDGRDTRDARDGRDGRDHREHMTSFRNERGDARRHQKDFNENDFPELPLKNRDKMIRPQPHLQQLMTTGDLSQQPNAWSKSRPKHPSDVREIIRGNESSEIFKSEAMRIGDRPFNLPDTSGKIEIVKTQTFENSRYSSNRRPPLTRGGSQEPSSSNVKKDLTSHRSNNRGRTRPMDKDYRNVNEGAGGGRPITKTSHLTDDYDDGGGVGGSKDQHRRNRFSVGKERGDLRDYRNTHHLGGDDRRGSDDLNNRSHPENRHFESYFNDNPADLPTGLSKLTLVDKNNRLLDSESKPKRYSSLRQHQAQPQQQQSNEPLSQHHQFPLQHQLQHPHQHQSPGLSQHKQPPPPQQQQQPPQPQPRDNQPPPQAQPNSNMPQYPSISQHLNLSHSRQSSNVQYYEATSGANQQPPSASYYIDNRSPQSSFGYIPTTTIEGGCPPPPPNATRFLSQIAPRFIPPPSAPPPPPTEPRFMAQAVAAANPATAGAGTLPSVIPGPPAATYLPTYPPGYPQYPPPPPQAAQFSIAPPPPPAPEMYGGGVTYYDTMTQQVSPRQLPQRRPKNALPIVPPPPPNSGNDGSGYDDQSDINQGVVTASC